MDIEQSAVKGDVGTGYEPPAGKGAFQCSNCEYFKADSCGQKLMMERSKQPKLPNGRIKVDSNGCCEYIERIGSKQPKRNCLKRG